MTLEETRNELRAVIIEKDPGIAFKLIEKWLTPDAQHDIDIIRARYSQYRREKGKGVLSVTEDRIEYQAIVAGLLDILKSLTDDDLIAGADVLDKHYDRILLVCSPERASHVKNKLFPNRYFPNAQVVAQTKEVSSESVDIVLYDKESFAPDFALYEQYVEFGPAPVLWFGQGFAPKVEGDVKNAFYYANSDFSVYARLREMLDYLKYFNADNTLA